MLPCRYWSCAEGESSLTESLSREHSLRGKLQVDTLAVQDMYAGLTVVC